MRTQLKGAPLKEEVEQRRKMKNTSHRNKERNETSQRKHRQQRHQKTKLTQSTVPTEMRTKSGRGGEKDRHGARRGGGAGRAATEPQVNGCEPPAHLLGTRGGHPDDLPAIPRHIGHGAPMENWKPEAQEGTASGAPTESRNGEKNTETSETKA